MKSEEGYRLYLYVRKVDDGWLASVTVTTDNAPKQAHYHGATRNEATKRAMDWAKALHCDG